MANVELVLPKMGESVAEATITSWLKAEGDTIEAEESVVEIATDKVDSEIPSPADGVISKILVAEGEVAQVGQVIAIISTGGDSPDPEVESVKTEAVPAAVAIQPVPTALKRIQQQQLIQILVQVTAFILHWLKILHNKKESQFPNWI